MKRSWLISLAALAVILPVGFFAGTRKVNADYNEDGTVTIDETNFPDKDFRDYVIKYCDENKDGSLDEREIHSGNGIGIKNLGISSLKGIEFFTNLRVLDCRGNKLTELDLSANPDLRYLYCYRNELVSLNVSTCTGLRELGCSQNQLSSLDVSNNPKLDYLHVDKNKLTSLDVGKKPELIILSCDHNQLTSLDVSGCTRLRDLKCQFNQLTELELGSNSTLKMLYCYSNQLTSLDVSKVKSSLSRILDGDKVDNGTYLSFLKNYCELTVDSFVNVISKTPSVEEIAIDETTFPDENFRTYVIEKIDTDGDKVLSEEEIKKTKVIDVANREITSLKGIEFFVFLDELHCNDNNLSSLDLSKNLNLQIIDCSSNQLSNLDLGENDVLYRLHCEYNFLTKLDISECPVINSIVYGRICNRNGGHFLRGVLSTICYYDEGCCSNVFDGDKWEVEYWEFYYDKNMRIIFSETPELPNLPKLSVAINEESFPDSSFRQFVTRYDENGDGSLDQDELYYIDTICVNNYSIKSLKGIEYFTNLKYLYCNSTSLTELDLHMNTKLRVLSCVHNKISTIDVSGTRLADYLESEWFEDEDGCRLRSDCDYGDYLQWPWSYISECCLYYDIGTEFIDSSSSVSSFIERLYTIALHRESEKAGKNFWVNEIESGNKTGGDCAHFFLIEAEEFRNRGLSEEDFVETLYKTFFGRDSEPAGKAFWVGELKSGAKTRNDVINGFIDSAEWCNLCASYGINSGASSAKADKASEGAENFATRLYTCCLGREPEEGGLKYWSLALTNLEKTGCEAAAFFFTGDEFVGFGLKNDEYVRRLYTTFMGREPEASEIAYWVGEIAKGTQTKTSVMQFFGSSEEFTNICKSYGIERGMI